MQSVCEGYDSKVMKVNVVIVLDIGKTLSKVSVWSHDALCLTEDHYVNQRVLHNGVVVLDVVGIEDWFCQALAGFAKTYHVTSIFPVAHGAAVCLITNDTLLHPPLDYEDAAPSVLNEQYEKMRDNFVISGSPSLGAGLNLGRQLFWLQTTYPALFQPDNHYLVAWPQFWAWRLCSVIAAELTSLGCHSDLWDPVSQDFSPLAKSRGWANMFGRLHRADDVLGVLNTEWIERTGLSCETKVFCGAHDSNVALHAARQFESFRYRDLSVLSTGTWFIGMKPNSAVSREELKRLSLLDDCLLNVSVKGEPVVSARFMGGREIAQLVGINEQGIDGLAVQHELNNAARMVVSEKIMVLPRVGRQWKWLNKPDDPVLRRTAVALYIALMTDALLTSIDSNDCVLIEGRFAKAGFMLSCLARLRASTDFYTSFETQDLALGALQLVGIETMLGAAFEKVAPLNICLLDYKNTWNIQVKQGACSV